MKLYSYWRSSASYRVRIALALKGLKAEIVPVNLLAGEQKGDAYRAVNPQMRVPALEDNGHLVTQSIAIVEYLDERYPQAPLLPQVPEERAYVRELSLAVATDISPLNNLSQLKYLSEQFGVNEEQKNTWIAHWIANGFAAIEAMLEASPYTSQFCHGASPTMADCLLIPQVYNARRFNCDLSAYPNIERIDANCAALPAFQQAHPDAQPDKPKS
jgi:maleylacetoacetate isomerase